MNAVQLVQLSRLDLENLLPLGRLMFDRSLSENADDMGFDPPLHHLLTIANFKDTSVRKPAECAPYLNLFHAGFCITTDERDFAEVLEIASMPCIMSHTERRGQDAAIIAGTLAQWRSAIVKGCQREVSQEARQIYNKVYTKFRGLGLAPAFDLSKSDHSDDKSFLLNYKT